MRRTLFGIACFVMFIVLFVPVANAVGFYAFGTVSVPTDNTERYAFQWLRVGLDDTVSNTGVGVHMNLNLSDGLAVKCANVTKDLRLGTSVLTPCVGKFLAPPQQSYPGAFSIQLADWPDAQRQFTGFGLGTQLTYVNGLLTARLAHYNGADGKLRLAFQADVGGGVVDLGSYFYFESMRLTVYGEEHVGVGGTFGSTSRWWFNPVVGGTTYTASKLGLENKTNMFVQNYVQAWEPLRFYAQYDWTNRDDTKNRWLLGSTFTFAPYSFVRVYYDTRAKEWLPSVAFYMKVTA